MGNSAISYYKIEGRQTGYASVNDFFIGHTLNEYLRNSKYGNNPQEEDMIQKIKDSMKTRTDWIKYFKEEYEKEKETMINNVIYNIKHGMKKILKKEEEEEKEKEKRKKNYALSLLENPGGIRVYRGIKDFKKLIETNKENCNNCIIDLGFSSTTTNYNITKNFIGEDMCCILSFYIPDDIKFYPYLLLHEGILQDQEDEQEIILETSLKFTVLPDSISTNTNIYNTTVEKYKPSSWVGNYD